MINKYRVYFIIIIIFYINININYCRSIKKYLVKNCEIDEIENKRNEYKILSILIQ